MSQSHISPEQLQILEAEQLRRIEEWRLDVQQKTKERKQRIKDAIAAYLLTDKSAPPPCPHCGLILNEVKLSYVEHMIHYTRQLLKVTGPGEATTEYYEEDVDCAEGDTNPETYCPGCDAHIDDDYFVKCQFDVTWDAEEIEAPPKENTPDCIATDAGFVVGV